MCGMEKIGVHNFITYVFNNTQSNRQRGIAREKEAGMELEREIDEKILGGGSILGGEVSGVIDKIGADVNGLSLSFTDGAYVDVFLNGVRLKHNTDYVTTTANTIGSLAALAASDEVEVVVFDVFSLADMVSSLISFVKTFPRLAS